MKKFLLFFIVFLGLFLCACKPENDPAGTVRIVVRDEAGTVLCDVEIEFTKKDSLEALVVDHEEILAKGGRSQYGLFIEEMCGVEAPENHFWKIYVDGEDPMLGVSMIPLKDKSTVEFVLTPFEPFE